jgi:predicted transcriptional regulator
LVDQEGVERLFFELASEDRFGILRELQKNSLRMQELARRLDLTATEAFRQLKRLSESRLVQRQPEGTYAITPLGKLVLELSSSLEFVFKNREYFLTHDIWRLPRQFVNRIAELSQTTLAMSAMKNVSEGERMAVEARQYMWGLTEEYLWGLTEGHRNRPVVSAVDELIHKGVKYKLLIPESQLRGLRSPRDRNVEIRGLPDIPASIALTEKEAIVCLRLVGGRMDYAGFLGKDPTFLDWVKGLFLYYWDKGKEASTR